MTAVISGSMFSCNEHCMDPKAVVNIEYKIQIRRWIDLGKIVCTLATNKTNKKWVLSIKISW